ncbi:MAG: glycosyltransferase [Armatimonadota bacterium]
MRSRRIVLTTFGSLGDLFPYVAIGRELQARGHRAEIATTEYHREPVEAAGLVFHPIRPEARPMEETREVIRRAMDARSGSAVVIREMLMPHLRDQYEDLLRICAGADFVVSHPITYATPLVAEKLRLRWAATLLQPMLLMSAYDPPVPPGDPWAVALYRFGPRVNAALMRVAKARVRRWVAPVDRLRDELGLPSRGNPAFEGQFSPYLNLALFSRVLAAPQPDWPEHLQVTGFPFYDPAGDAARLPEEVEAFLAAGEPPIVFTLGSSAVLIGDDFYVESVAAAQRLGRRALLLAGKAEWNRLPHPLPPGVLAVEYAPHGLVFPRACAVVHQGGVGTTGQALRSGRPMLVVPFAHDQPDHAARITRLGVGLGLARARYRAGAAAERLERLLTDPAYARKAEEVGRIVRAEDGVRTAADAIEGCLA